MAPFTKGVAHHGPKRVKAASHVPPVAVPRSGGAGAGNLIIMNSNAL